MCWVRRALLGSGWPERPDSPDARASGDSGVHNVVSFACLAREVLVYGELVNLRCPGSPDSGHRGSDAFLREAVEVSARLPEVQHAPATVDRTGRVKHESVRGIAVRVDRRIEPVDLLGGPAGELDADSYSHRSSLIDRAT